MSFDGKSIFIVGGTGTLGRELVKQILENYEPIEVVVFSRDEQKQFRMRQKIKDRRVKFILGDVRDLPTLSTYVIGSDVIIHTAALKHIHSAEEQPLEAIKTNVEGSRNVLEAARRAEIEDVVLISTDKAVEPTTAYGASKMLAEKLFMSEDKTIVRYGNVLGSKGSVIETWEKAKAKGRTRIDITDEEMTRFFITIKDAASFVLYTARNCYPGIHIPDPSIMKRYKMVDLIPEGLEYRVIGKRPAEKLHEKIMASEENYKVTIYPNIGSRISKDGISPLIDVTSEVNDD